jgi:hypothetical protein
MANPQMCRTEPNLENPFPSRITVRAMDGPADGLAVRLRFDMKAKNSFSYVLFLGFGGIGYINGEDLLRCFYDQIADSPMDYVDPRAGFTGEVTACVMTDLELEAALKAYKLYRPYVAFPAGYEEYLNAAIARHQKADDYRLELTLEHVPR